jgi:hypothetical protein
MEKIQVIDRIYIFKDQYLGNRIDKRRKTMANLYILKRGFEEVRHRFPSIGSFIKKYPPPKGHMGKWRWLQFLQNSLRPSKPFFLRVRDSPAKIHEKIQVKQDCFLVKTHPGRPKTGPISHIP